MAGEEDKKNQPTDFMGLLQALLEQNSGKSTGSSLPPYADTHQLVLGTQPGRVGSFPAPVPQRMTVYDVTRGDASGWVTKWLSNASRQDRADMVTMLRASGFLGPRSESDSAIRSAIGDAADQAAAQYEQGNKVDLFDFIRQKAMETGGPSGGGSGSGSGYSGPVSSVSVMDPQSAGNLLNKLAVDKLGRNLTDEELAQYTKDFRASEMQNPTVSSGSGASRFTQEGMSDTEIADQIIRENPVFADNVLKTDVLDMFFNRIGGKNG